VLQITYCAFLPNAGVMQITHTPVFSGFRTTAKSDS